MTTIQQIAAAPTPEPVVVVVKSPPKPVVKKSATATAAVNVKSTKPVAPAKKSTPIAKTPAQKRAPVKAAKKVVAPVKTEKVKKPKMVRDSFTIPKAEYVVLDELKQRANKLTRPAKKSELLRAGIKALAALSDAAFLTALARVPAIKTGRPGNES